MPLVKIDTSAQLTVEIKQQIVAELSKLVAQTIGKPEQYVMVTIAPAQIMLSACSEPAVFADVRSIGGLTSAVNGELCKGICDIFKRHAAIPAERVYANFTEIAPANWGWRSSTFG